ncbi:MAG: hypothetical protein RLZZ420_666 [Bacteroidota bacterium]|jgi:hypothetical protein
MYRYSITHFKEFQIYKNETLQTAILIHKFIIYR